MMCPALYLLATQPLRTAINRVYRQKKRWKNARKAMYAEKKNEWVTTYERSKNCELEKR